MVAKVDLNVRTGTDDLRGGRDNVNLTVFYLLNGRRQQFVFNNVNKSKKWRKNSRTSVRLSLPRSVPVETITGYKLDTTFRGGIRGDNWNVNRLELDLRDSGGVSKRNFRTCNAPLRDEKKYKGRRVYRFTGDRKTYSVKCKKGPRG